MGRHSTSAGAGHKPWARVHSLGCHRTSGFSAVKSIILRANTVDFARFSLFYGQYSQLSRSLSRGGSFDRLSTLLLTGTSPKSWLGCHVRFE